MTYAETYNGIEIYTVGHPNGYAIKIFGKVTHALGTIETCRNIIDIDSQNMGA
jgi:hypothetical protein